MGSNVETLGKYIFYGDHNLKIIIIKSTKLKAVDEKAFSNMGGDVMIYVPASKYEEYKELLRNKGQKKTVKIRRLKISIKLNNIIIMEIESIRKKQ